MNRLTDEQRDSLLNLAEDRGAAIEVWERDCIKDALAEIDQLREGMNDDGSLADALAQAAGRMVDGALNEDWDETEARQELRYALIAYNRSRQNDH